MSIRTAYSERSLYVYCYNCWHQMADHRASGRCNTCESVTWNIHRKIVEKHKDKCPKDVKKCPCDKELRELYKRQCQQFSDSPEGEIYLLRNEVDQQ